MEDDQNIRAYFKMYHPSGLLVSLDARAPAGDYASLMVQVTKAIEAGWLVQPQGVEEGERVERIRWIVFARKSDGTPCLDLYVDHDRMHHSIVRCYLDNDQQIADFERATGCKLASLTEYIGTGRIERGKDPRMNQFIREIRLTDVVVRPNPDYKPDEDDPKKRGSKLKFVRWVNIAPAATTPAPGQPKIAGEQDWIDWLAKSPSLAAVNGVIPDIERMAEALRAAVWPRFLEYAKTQGWAYNQKPHRHFKDRV